MVSAGKDVGAVEEGRGDEDRRVGNAKTVRKDGTETASSDKQERY